MPFIREKCGETRGGHHMTALPGLAFTAALTVWTCFDAHRTKVEEE